MYPRLREFLALVEEPLMRRTQGERDDCMQEYWSELCIRVAARIECGNSEEEAITAVIREVGSPCKVGYTLLECLPDPQRLHLESRFGLSILLSSGIGAWLLLIDMVCPYPIMVSVLRVVAIYNAVLIPLMMGGFIGRQIGLYGSIFRSKWSARRSVPNLYSLCRWYSRGDVFALVLFPILGGGLMSGVALLPVTPEDAKLGTHIPFVMFHQLSQFVPFGMLLSLFLLVFASVIGSSSSIGFRRSVA